MPKTDNNEAIKLIRSIMLHTLNGEARKHGTRPTGRFRLSQTSLNIPYTEPHELEIINAMSSVFEKIFETPCIKLMNVSKVSD